jgi:restriction system protein
MPVPTYDQFIEPVLRYLAAAPDGAPARDVHDGAAATLGLTDADRAELLPSGVQPVYKNRSGWAHNRLKLHGLSSSVRRGFWKLTAAGREFIAAHPAQLTNEVVEQLAADKADVRLRTAASVPPRRPGSRRIFLRLPPRVQMTDWKPRSESFVKRFRPNC